MSTSPAPNILDYWRSLNPDAGGAEQPAAPTNPYGLGPQPNTPPPQASPGTTNTPAVTQPDVGAYWKTLNPDTRNTSQGGDQKKPEPEPSLTDFFVNRLPHSGKDFVSNIFSAVTHPGATVDSMGALLAGGVKAVARDAGFDMPENRADEVARAFGNYAASRWGSADKIQEAFYKDPVGMLSDFSMVANTLGGVAKLAQVGAEAGDLARIAQVAKTAGKVAGTAGDVTNLAWYPGALAKGAGAVVSRLLPRKAELPAFDPRTAEFEGGLPGDFDLKTKTFEPPSRFTVGSAPKPAPASDPEALRQEAISQRAYDLAKLRQGETIQLPNWEEWRQADQDIRARPPKPPETPEAPATPKPQPAAAPATPAAKPAFTKKTIGGMLAGAGVTGLALDLLTHHVLGSLGAGVIGGAAVKFLPELLRSETGQAMLARLGPNSNAATVAGVARDLVPALASLHKSQQPIVVDPLRAQQLPPALQARGGPVNDELARLQRSHLPGIHAMLYSRK